MSLLERLVGAGVGTALILAGIAYLRNRARYERWFAEVVSSADVARRNRVAMAVIVPLFMLVGVAVLLGALLGH